MRILIAIVTTFLLAACASAPQQSVYPAWLEMKEGYAQACAAAGKCVPMTDARDAGVRHAGTPAHAADVQQGQHLKP